MTFRLSCVPPRTTHQHKRIVRIGAFSRLADKPELVAAKGMLDGLLLPHQPRTPVLGPITLALEFTWPWLASQSRRVRALGRVPHTSKPDLTNVTKTIEDRLVALRFIEDDRAVVDLHVTKYWGESPGIVVSIEPWVMVSASTQPDPHDQWATMAPPDRFSAGRPRLCLWGDQASALEGRDTDERVCLVRIEVREVLPELTREAAR